MSRQQEIYRWHHQKLSILISMLIVMHVFHDRFYPPSKFFQTLNIYVNCQWWVQEWVGCYFNPLLALSALFYLWPRLLRQHVVFVSKLPFHHLHGNLSCLGIQFSGSVGVFLQLMPTTAEHLCQTSHDDVIRIGRLCCLATGVGCITGTRLCFQGLAVPFSRLCPVLFPVWDNNNYWSTEMTWRFYCVTYLWVWLSSPESRCLAISIMAALWPASAACSRYSIPLLCDSSDSCTVESLENQLTLYLQWFILFNCSAIASTPGNHNTQCILWYT